VLRPGGALVVETMHRDRLARIFQPNQWEPLPDGGLLLEARRFDQVAGWVDNDFVVIGPDGTRESLTYRIQSYTATDLVRLVEEAGFGGIECYGGAEGEELRIETRLVLLARA
jgi:hypothetical protein